MLQLNYKFYSSLSLCDPNKYELIETDTDDVYMALCEKNLDERNRLTKKRIFVILIKQNDCTDNFQW